MDLSGSMAKANVNDWCFYPTKDYDTAFVTLQHSGRVSLYLAKEIRTGPPMVFDEHCASLHSMQAFDSELRRTCCAIPVRLSYSKMASICAFSNDYSATKAFRRQQFTLTSAMQVYSERLKASVCCRA